MVFLKEFFEKVDFEKKSADDKKHENNSHIRLHIMFTRLYGALEMMTFMQIKGTMKSWFGVAFNH